MDKKKLLRKALSGSKNMAFGDMTALAEAFGFKLSRISGSNQIYTHSKVSELVNLQEVGRKAKPYQIRQFLRLVEEYGLELEDED